MAQPLSSINAIVGLTVTSIARVLYEYRGVIEPVDGALEIELDGRVVLLDATADGEQLRIREQLWEDPFREPLSPDNKAYVERHGRWRRVICSKDAPYSDIVGRSVGDVGFLENEWHRIGGMRITVGSRSLWFVVEGDECHVYWNHPQGFVEACS
jgi:hypothetical protein